MAESGRRRPRFDFIATGTAPFSGASVGSVWWRIAAANNRALGRSASTFDTLADCREHARRLQDHIDDLMPSYASDARGRWTWSASLDTAVTARSVRPFARRLDCVRTLALFLDAARAADVTRADLRQLAFRPRNDQAGSDDR